MQLVISGCFRWEISTLSQDRGYGVAFAGTALGFFVTYQDEPFLSYNLVVSEVYGEKYNEHVLLFIEKQGSIDAPRHKVVALIKRMRLCYPHLFDNYTTPREGAEGASWS